MLQTLITDTVGPVPIYKNRPPPIQLQWTRCGSESVLRSVLTLMSGVLQCPVVFRHSRPPATSRLSMTRVWSDGNAAQLATVLSRGPNTVRQDGSAPANCRWSRRWCPVRVGARASAVRSLLQSSCRHHRSPWCTVPSIHRRHAAVQLHLTMHANNTSAGLSVLAECSIEARQWYLLNGLQLNPDKSEALIVGTSNPLCAICAIYVHGRRRSTGI